MKYTKNIDYVPAGDALKWVNSGRMPDPISVLAMAAMYLQGTRGAQMIVAKSVTDELDRTDMLSSVSFADVPWPADSLEFYFEDPKLPTLLVNHVSNIDLDGAGLITEAKSKRYAVDQKLVRIFVYGGLDNRECNAVSYSNEDMDVFMRSNKSMEYRLEGSHPLSETEENDMRDFARLIFKVLVYAAVPRCRPAKVSQKDIQYGRGKVHPHGKPGHKGRPVTPIYRVVSLPVHAHQAAHDGVGDGGNRRFLGRRGHFHYYRHKRFTHRQGTFDYFPEITAEAVKTIYKVR